MTEFSELFDTQYSNASARIAIHIDVGTIKFNDFNPQRYINWHKIPNYALQVVHAGFVLNTNNFFFKILDETVQNLLSGGLINIIISDCISTLPNENLQIESTTFSMDSLSFGFVILTGCLLICFVVFVFEILIWNVKSCKRRKNCVNVELKSTQNAAIIHSEIVQYEIKNFVEFLFSAVGKNWK
jgi:hypothetical protein